MQWLKDEFLSYFKQWEESVRGREGFMDVQKKRMLLSDQTILGLRMTGKCTKSVQPYVNYAVHFSHSFVLHRIDRVLVFPSGGKGQQSGISE